MPIYTGIQYFLCVIAPHFGCDHSRYYLLNQHYSHVNWSGCTGQILLKHYRFTFTINSDDFLK